jgi:type I restriction enzyme S subunit
MYSRGVGSPSKRRTSRITPITIRFGGDIEARDRDKAFAGAMYAVRPSDLVFSKIDVRNGAIGLLPEAIGAAVVTSEYPVYVPDPEQVDAAFLAWLLRTAPFKVLLQSAASGTSGRKRVHPDQFEALQVPLP